MERNPPGFTRRGFLRATSATVVGGLTATEALASGAFGPSMPEFAPGSPTLDQFAGLLGSTFRVIGGSNGSREVSLIEAIPLPRPRARGFREPFRLVFRGKPGLDLPQGVYGFESARLGLFDLFVVPNGLDRPSDLVAIFG